MPEPGATSDRLEVLKARWEADRGSRVFLQLADEYRRLGRIEEAAQVLEEGLEATPRHTAAQVALGRCQLELGRTDAAVATLEAVLEGDPTQMVAYRLLVEAYLDQGKAEEARERLRFYTLLNDADPDIAELRRRIGELDRGGRGAAPPTEPAQEEIRDEAEEETREEPPETREEPRDRAADAAPGGLEAGGAGGDEPPSPSDPFPDLSDTQYRRRFDESAGGGDLFGGQRSAPEREEPAEPPAPGPPAEPPAVEEGQEEPETAREEGGAAPATRPAGENVFELPPPPPPPSQDLGELLGGDAEDAVEPEPGAAEPPEATPDAAADRSPEPSTDPGEPPPPPPAAPAAGGEAPRPTVTLGRLYLRQGHAAEAEGIFRAVLERDPDNEEARRHLEELARAPAPALDAAELLEGFAAGEHDGLTERKRHVLERYLDRVRGRSAHDVR